MKRTREAPANGGTSTRGAGRGRIPADATKRTSTPEDEPNKRRSMAKLPDEPISMEFEKPRFLNVSVKFNTQLICNSRKGVEIGGPEEPVEWPEDDAPQGKKTGKKKRPPVDFDKLFRDHCYLLPDRKLPAKKFQKNEKFPHWKNVLGFPSKAFKDVIISSLCHKLGFTPWSIKPFVHCFGLGEDPSLVVLRYKYGRVRPDTLPIVKGGVRTGMHTTWRPELWGVETDFRVEWNPQFLGQGEKGMMNVVNALKFGGQWLGVGDGRNEKSGYPVGLFYVTAVAGSRK